MSDLNSLKFEDYKTCVGQIFSVILQDTDSLELELIQIKAIGVFDPRLDSRQPFSLLFRGPVETMLPQGSYELKNTTLGVQHVFLVPVGPDESGVLYDATFS